MQLEQLGPYRLGTKIGQGGMGSVYAAVDTESGDPAAVKVLSPTLAAEEGFRVRFEAEIESLKKLRHPNIVRLYGYGEQAGTLFYAMELVPGTSLEDELRAGRRFDWREVTGIAIKLCRALKHAHDHGVIHRDLKPANLLLTPDGEIKLSDFGIARLFGNTRLTSDGGVLGTAEYMAPEQASGGTVTDRCDQYSLGGVMYALLAGRPPFRAKSLVEMLQLQRYAEPDPINRYAPQTPAELARIIHQLLEKDPQKRFANTLILGRSLEAMERGLSISESRSDFIVSEPGNVAASWLGNQPLGPTLSPTQSAEPEPPSGATGNPAGPVTAATLAHSHEAIAPVIPAASPREATDTEARFTKVEAQRAGGSHDASDNWANVLSGQTMVLVLALAMLVAAAWYLMQPPSADKLYAEIEAATADGDVQSLKAVQPRIELFLNTYPDDPRVEQVLVLGEEARQTHPIQRAYTAAKRLSLIDPDAAAIRFQALVDLYDDGDAAPETVRHFVKLSRQKLRQLEKQNADRVADDRRIIESRLARAAELATDNPAAAGRIYRGIVSVYGEKSWANDLVAQAEAGLNQIAARPPAGQ
jgi:serine/threonine-protein kinase